MKTQGQLPRGAEPTSRARTSRATSQKSETSATASTETLSPAVGGAAAPLQPLAESRRPGQEKRKKKEEASEGPRARAQYYRWTTCAIPSGWEPLKAAREEAKRQGRGGVHVLRAFLAAVIKEAEDGMQDRKEKEWQAGLKAFKAEVVDKAARPEDLEIICPYFRCATVGAPRLLLPKTAIVTWCFAPEGNEATKKLLAACTAAGGEAKVGPIPLPRAVFNRIQQQAQEACQEVCHPHKKKKGKGHGTTKTLIMAALLTCKGQRARVEWTTYDFPHCLVPAKEEAKRAFMAIVMEAEEGMQKGKEWQAGLKVYKEERAGKGSSHEAQSRPAGQ